MTIVFKSQCNWLFWHILKVPYYNLLKFVQNALENSEISISIKGVNCLSFCSNFEKMKNLS
jgi:hypothetical protein